MDCSKYLGGPSPIARSKIGSRQGEESDVASATVALTYQGKLTTGSKCERTHVIARHDLGGALRKKEYLGRSTYILLRLLKFEAASDLPPGALFIPGNQWSDWVRMGPM